MRLGSMICGVAFRNRNSLGESFRNATRGAPGRVSEMIRGTVSAASAKSLQIRPFRSNNLVFSKFRLGCNPCILGIY